MKRLLKRELRIVSRQGHKKSKDEVKRIKKKRSKKRSIFRFFDNARKHSLKKGEPFYFGAKRYKLNSSKSKPQIPQTSSLLLKKSKSFTDRKPDFYNNGIINLPITFSLLKSPNESYSVLKDLLYFLYKGRDRVITLDYKRCEEIDLDASVCMDIILMEYNLYLKECLKTKYVPIVRNIKPINYQKPALLKILYSIGAFSNVKGLNIKYKDIICYPLCINNKRVEEDAGLKITHMVDYIQECLSKMQKKLNTDSIKNLCHVIGEILINAEEHSTTDYSFSIGYFQDSNHDTSEHKGIFNLVIFNYGDTIYEKFSSPDCQNMEIKDRMNELSQIYIKKNFFGNSDFTEETLWTLYALQEGVTSVPKEKFRKRGNGSIRFIESFFELKGTGTEMDDVSKMTILSGNTKIIFDGRHEIKNVKKGNTTFKIMVFNKDGDIESKPDKKNVTFVDNFFPGTLISAKILISDNDTQQ